MGWWKSFWKRRVDAARRTCSRIRRGLTREANLSRATFSQLFSRLSVFQSSQLPVIGSWVAWTRAISVEVARAKSNKTLLLDWRPSDRLTYALLDENGT